MFLRVIERSTNDEALRKAFDPFPDEIGYLNHRLMAVHLTEATKEETQLLASKGAGMILCSGSIAIIDGIIPPAAEFLEVSDDWHLVLIKPPETIAIICSMK